MRTGLDRSTKYYITKCWDKTQKRIPSRMPPLRQHNNNAFATFCSLHSALLEIYLFSNRTATTSTISSMDIDRLDMRPPRVNPRTYKGLRASEPFTTQKYSQLIN